MRQTSDAGSHTALFQRPEHAPTHGLRTHLVGHRVSYPISHHGRSRDMCALSRAMPCDRVGQNPEQSRPRNLRGRSHRRQNVYAPDLPSRPPRTLPAPAATPG